MNLDRMIAVRTRKTVYRDGDRCVKVFDKSYSRADVLQEALNQARAEECGVPVPPLREVTVMDGKWAIVSDYIKGKPLSRLMQQHPERREAYLALFVQTQCRLLEKPCPLLPSLEEKLSRHLAAADLPDALRQQLTERLAALRGEPRCLCHGEFTFSNVIPAEDGQVYVLDFAHAASGPAVADAAQTYLLLFLAQGEENAGAYLACFEKQSGIPSERVLDILPVVAAANLERVTVEKRKCLRRLSGAEDAAR